MVTPVAVQEGAQEPLLSLPNLLTLSRLPLAVLVWVVRDDPVWLIAVIGHFPRNTGRRFSAKAVSPSRASSLWRNGSA